MEEFSEEEEVLAAVRAQPGRKAISSEGITKEAIKVVMEDNPTELIDLIN